VVLKFEVPHQEGMLGQHPLRGKPEGTRCGDFAPDVDESINDVPHFLLLIPLRLRERTVVDQDVLDLVLVQGVALDGG
jgi:hypothetical protein